MKISNLKKGKSLIITLILFVLVITPFVANAQEMVSRQHLAAPRISVNQTTVDAGEHVEVTVTFIDNKKREVPFGVEATNGATILVKTRDDINFTTNTIATPVSSIEMNENSSKMQLLTGVSTANKVSTLTFSVESPVDVDFFKVVLTTDSEKYPVIESKDITVKTGMTVNAPDVVNNVDAFDVNGIATFKGEEPPTGSYVFLEIVSKDPKNPCFKDIQLDAKIVKGVYQFQPIRLSSDCPEGIYIMKLYLFDQYRMKLLGYIEKEILFEKVTELELKGTVLDSYERGIEGAVATLYRLDEETEDWFEWSDPDGKQTSERISDVNGEFGWKVEAGQYEIRVFHPDYHEADDYYTTLFDVAYGVVEVPEVRDVFIMLEK